MYFLNLLSVVYYAIYKYESLHTKHETAVVGRMYQMYVIFNNCP